MKALKIFVLLAALCSLQVQAGSIYKDSAGRSARLFGDDKAHRVGDIVTILIMESNSASETSQVGTEKKHDFDFRLTHLFGLGDNLFNKEEGTDLTRGRFGGSNQFDGQAKTSNTGRVTAQLAATVKEVLPNGNLLIEGQRSIFVNKEKKNIILTGVIRPRDITSNNTIQSTYIADAAITFEGVGQVTSQSQPGLLSKLFSWIPLF